MINNSQDQRNSNHQLAIGIVGAGLMGRLSAWSLARQGYSVTLIDQDSSSGEQSAGFAAAGLLAPLGESLHCQRNIVDMGMLSLSLWPKLLASLPGPVYFQQNGALMISHAQDQGNYSHFVQYIQRHFSGHQIQLIDGQQLRELEPELSCRFTQAVLLGEEGQIDNRGLLVALQKALSTLKVRCLNRAKVVDIQPNNSGCSLGYTNSAQQHLSMDFDLVIDCRGIGAKTSLADPKTKPLHDLRAVRGEIFRLSAPDVHLHRPIRLMHPRYQLYISPKPNHIFLVGATEIDSDDKSPMTVRSAMELLTAAYSVHPGFAEAHIVEQSTHLRPAFSDNQPQVQIKQRLIQVNGLYRHGFLIAPVVLTQVEKAVIQSLQHSNDDALGQYCHLLPITRCS